MAGLREQIEASWKDASYAYEGWRSLLPARPFLSDNTVYYGILWQVTLHYNNCPVGLCNGKCNSGAADLVKRRLECMARGMPDLHPDEESDIWEIAFNTHREFCEEGRTNQGSIKPLWSDPKDGLNGRCNCFEVAKAQYDLLKKVDTTHQVTPVFVREEDVWYDEQRME
jgi:hypothetical protein